MTLNQKRTSRKGKKNGVGFSLGKGDIFFPEKGKRGNERKFQGSTENHFGRGKPAPIRGRAANTRRTTERKGEVFRKKTTTGRKRRGRERDVRRPIVNSSPDPQPEGRGAGKVKEGGAGGDPDRKGSEHLSTKKRGLNNNPFRGRGKGGDLLA